MASSPRGVPGTAADPLATLAASLAERPYARRGVPLRADRRVRVLLADDHPLFRAGLLVALRHVCDVEVVGEASTGAEAVQQAELLHPDVVVMDLEMPHLDGLAATRLLAERAPATRVLVLTMHSEEERLLPLLEAGAHGYLSKEAAERELADAIRVVASGEVYVRPRVARLLAASRDASPPAESAARDAYALLSERERTVLRLTAEGYGGAEIGRTLQISNKTVDTYKQRIEEKLGVKHRTDYVRFALRLGLLHA